MSRSLSCERFQAQIATRPPPRCADIADLLQRLDESAAAADALPHRRKYLLLVNRFLRRFVDLHVELVDDVERQLTPSRPPARAGRSKA